MALCRRNTRIQFGLALSFVGPCHHILSPEHVGAQLVGSAGLGKSTIGKIASAPWGHDPSPDHLYGAGDSWNSTRNGIETIAVGYRHTFAYLDETNNAPPDGRGGAAAYVLDAITVIAEGRGKTRFGQRRVNAWFTPFLSTSNPSIVALLKQARRDLNYAYVDRCLDIPMPVGGHGFFEDLHGFADVGQFAAAIRQLAEQNHGWPGYVFVTRLVRWYARDHAGLQEFFTARQRAYLARATDIRTPSRDLTRVHRKFATVYAAGCLAIEFDVLPFAESELLSSILSCEREHAAFVAQEVHRHFGVNPREAFPLQALAPRSELDPGFRTIG